MDKKCNKQTRSCSFLSLQPFIANLCRQRFLLPRFPLSEYQMSKPTPTFPCSWLCDVAVLWSFSLFLHLRPFISLSDLNEVVTVSNRRRWSFICTEPSSPPPSSPSLSNFTKSTSLLLWPSKSPPHLMYWFIIHLYLWHCRLTLLCCCVSPLHVGPVGGRCVLKLSQPPIPDLLMANKSCAHVLQQEGNKNNYTHVA